MPRRSSPPMALILMKTITIGIIISIPAIILMLHFSQKEIASPASGAYYEIHGIDVSHHQGTINWNKVKQATLHGKRITFAFAKCTEGITHTDRHYNRNRKGIKKAGIIAGAYHFFVPGRNPQKQAENFIRHAQLTSGDLPPVLDIEYAGRLSDRQLTDDLLIWLGIVEDHFHCVPIIYSGSTFYLKRLNDSRLKRYPFWKAHYRKNGKISQDTWLFCQYTKQGNVAGIGNRRKVPVDLNVFHGNLDELRDLLIR